MQKTRRKASSWADMGSSVTCRAKTLELSEERQGEWVAPTEPPEVRSLHLQQWEYTEEAGTAQQTRLSSRVPGVGADQDSKLGVPLSLT